MKVLLERFPYRFKESEDRGIIEKFNSTTGKWHLMYECDSQRQLMTAMEDIEYTKWLDSDQVPCYRKNRGDRVVSPYKK